MKTIKCVLAVIFGIAFGISLSIGGATTYDYHVGFFLFRDFRILQLVVSTILFAMLLIWILKRLEIHRCVIHGDEIDYKTKPYNNFLVLGSILFGIGWAMSGSCPGTAPIMLTEGKLSAIFVITGILAGTWIATKLGIKS